MTEQELIYISIILNMAVDGKCDLKQLSPAVAEFVEGAVKNYKGSTDKEKEVLYWHAHEALKPFLNRKLH